MMIDSNVVVITLVVIVSALFTLKMLPDKVRKVAGAISIAVIILVAVFLVCWFIENRDAMTD